MTLVAESNESSEFVLRLLRKGVVLGRYVRSGTDHLPSFELANDMAGWFQRADIPFILRPNQFLIKSKLPSWQFATDYLLLTGVHTPGVNATGSVLMLWIIALEIMHGEPVTATILSEKTGISKSTISNTIDHLISDGYLTRQLDRFDERSSMLSLTLSDEHRVAVQALFATYFLM
jgi:DNA-binding transcriptional ArsR family regulator